MLLGLVSRRSFLGKAMGAVAGMTVLGGFARSTNAGGCWGYGGGCYGGCGGGEWSSASSSAYGCYGYNCAGCYAPSNCGGCYGGGYYHGCSGGGCYGGGSYYHGCYAPSCGTVHGASYHTTRTAVRRKTTTMVARHVPKATCGVPQAASQARYASYGDSLKMAASSTGPRSTANVALSLLEY